MYLAQVRQAATGLTAAGGSSLVNTTKAQYASKTRSVSLGKVFDKVDANGDGVVSKEEFDRAKTETAGQGSDGLSGVNTDSTASLVSLLQSVSQTSATGETGSSNGATQSGAVSSEQLFGKIDANGDGVITKDEFQNLRSSLKSGSDSTGTSSSTGSTQGTKAKSSATNPFSADENLAISIESQKKALMQAAVSQYKQLAQAGQISGNFGNTLFTG
jgi:Ca2+-binding EF-hand superfamily protein